MESAEEFAIILVIVIAALALFLFVAKRILRLAVRLLFAGVLIMALMAAGAIGWWNGWFGASTEQKTQRPAASRRSGNR